MADADDATSALIAQMLANDYQNQRSSYYEMPSSDEEDRKRKAKKRKRTKSKGSKSKVAKKSAAVKNPPKKKVQVPKASVQSNENNGKNTANKSSTGQTVTKNGKVRKKPRRWTAEEEVLFLEALELHGREWHKCVEHMGHTRNKGSFTSHAQKHFIKLYLADKPLPAKVVESGEGYTLSGKPLDPNSAAARAYGVGGKVGKAAYRLEMEMKKQNVVDAEKLKNEEQNQSRESISNSNTIEKNTDPSTKATTANDNDKNNESIGKKKVSTFSASGQFLLLFTMNLIDEGKSVISCKYKDTIFTGDVTECGLIQWNDSTYSSPSSFSLAAKRSITPGRQGDNGWDSCTFKGEKLKIILDRCLHSGESDTVSNDANENDKDVTNMTGTKVSKYTLDEAKVAKLSGRQRNDLMLAKARVEGVNLGQKTNGIRDTRATSAFTAAAAAAAELKKQKKLEARQAAAEKKRKEVNDRRLAREKAKREKLLAKTMEADARNRDLYGSDGRTEYSRKRRRRKVASVFTHKQQDSLQFVQCRRYPGIPGTGERSSQPFRILVAPSVVVMADLHAHFTHREVIGYLAGHWDAPRRTITISKVFPGRSICCNDVSARVEAEMDPVTEVGLRSEVAAAGLKVVGWYHSHPTFEPIPSMVDVNNQASYQQLFSDPSTGASESPFVALIVSPYDVQMPTDASTAKWFHVRSPNTERVPMKLEVDVSAQYEVCDISSKSVIIVENETKCSNKEEETKDKPVSKSPWSDSDSLRFDIGVKIMKRLLPEACALATKLGCDPLEAASIVDWNRVFRVVGADEPRSNISKLMESLRLRLRKSFGPKENDDDPSIESTILPSKNSWSEVCAKFIAELKLHVMKVASRNTTAGKSENESDAANETVAI